MRESRNQSRLISTLHFSLRIFVGDDGILDAVIDGAVDDAAIGQVLFGVIGPITHNACSPAASHAVNFE